jgi:hypothetical protein
MLTAVHAPGWACSAEPCIEKALGVEKLLAGNWLHR